MKAKIIKNISNNWKSALTVSLVSIPLAIALTLASGGTPTQGVITAFGAGIIGALFGGSQFNIIGPTGALSGILISYTVVNGGGGLPVIAIFSGLIILVLYFLHIDKYIIFIPSSVVQGFTLGVSFIISLGQLDNMLGLSNLVKDENIIVNSMNSLNNIDKANLPVFIIFAVSLAFIILWNKKFPKIPGSIIVALFGIILVYILKITGSEINITTLGDKYPNINGTLFENNFSSFSVSLLTTKSLWTTSVAVAVIAILETLLSAQIAQNITKVKFNRKKEVIGLAFANISSGLLGGIPATAALARTVLNIKSGAVHKTSGILNGIFIATIAVFLLKFFTLLPMTIIAAILVGVAYGMIEFKHFVHFWKYEKVSFGLAFFVAATTLIEDPIVGILLGTAVALIIFVNKISSAQTEILLWKNYKLTESILKNDFIKKENVNSDIVAYKISGMLTYINMPAHLEAVTKIKGNKYVIVSLRSAFYADSDGIHFLNEIIDILKNQNEKLYLASINKEIMKYVEHEEFYKQKLEEGKIFHSTSKAINHILKKNSKYHNTHGSEITL